MFSFRSKIDVLVGGFLALLLPAILLAGCAPKGGAPPEAAPVPYSEPKPAQAGFNPDGIISPGEYAHSQAYGDYSLHWSSDAENIYLAMSAKTPGYVAFGIQPGKTMKDADIIIGLVVDGKAQLLDTYSTGDYGPHPEDTAQGGSDDILKSGGRQDGGYTTIELKRALKTGDAFDQALVKGTNKVMWAYSMAADPGTKHIARGSGEISID
jgi:hypothetical protein